MNPHGKLALDRMTAWLDSAEITARTTGDISQENVAANYRPVVADISALLAHCERLETALADMVRWMDTGDISHNPSGHEYDVVTIARAALAAKVTP